MLGDRNRRDNVEIYRKVGRALRPVRDMPDPDIVYPFVGNEDDTIDWLARFDD